MESCASFSFTPFHALIVAAGSGTRAGGEIPKQYRAIGGKTVLRHTLEKFLACPEMLSVTVVINPAHRDLYDASVTGLNLPPPITGGATRSESVRNALLTFPSHPFFTGERVRERGMAATASMFDFEAASPSPSPLPSPPRSAGERGFSSMPDDIILIHDAARPFVTASEIRAVATAATTGAATLAAPVADTLLHTDGTFVSRDNLWSVQTPQGFRADIIRRAHASGNDATDDTALVAALGEKITIVPGNRTNFKITTAEDFAMAEKLLTGIPRTGLGFDVHAFDPARPGPVRLCGIDVPHAHTLLGHSDADVGLHALTDALLGAIAAGDIGQHFPPSDSQWKNADSAAFLRHAVALVEQAGGRIGNVDITLICEAPKVGPHRATMQARVAEICGLAPMQVGIKATTTEGLGFTGRREGIAAQAVATVIMPPC